MASRTTPPSTRPKCADTSQTVEIAWSASSVSLLTAKRNSKSQIPTRSPRTTASAAVEADPDEEAVAALIPAWATMQAEVATVSPKATVTSISLRQVEPLPSTTPHLHSSSLNPTNNQASKRALQVEIEVASEAAVAQVEAAILLAHSTHAPTTLFRIKVCLSSKWVVACTVLNQILGSSSKGLM